MCNVQSAKRLRKGGGQVKTGRETNESSGQTDVDSQLANRIQQILLFL